MDLNKYSQWDILYQVNSFQLLDKATYTYENCVNDKCNNLTKVVKAKLGNRVLAIEMENQEKLSDVFLNNYVGLKYNDNTLYGSDIQVLDRYKNTIYLGVPSLVHEYDKILLTINTREKEYDILLKEALVYE